MGSQMVRKFYEDYWKRDLVDAERMDSWKGESNWFSRHVVLETMGGIPGRRLLDVGCGGGFHLEHFSKKFEAEGIDFSDSAIEICKSKGLRAIRHDLNDGLPYPDETFDVVYSNSIFMHVEFGSLYWEMMRVLKPGGLIVCVECLDAWWCKIPRFFMSYKKTKPSYCSWEELDNHFRFEKETGSFTKYGGRDFFFRWIGIWGGIKS